MTAPNKQCFSVKSVFTSRDLCLIHRQIINLLSDSKGIWTHNHLAQRRTLNHLAKLSSLVKWLSFCLRTKWLWVWSPLLSLKLQIWRLLRARNSLTFRQTVECRSTLKLVCDMTITYRWIYLSLSIKFFTGESCSPIPVRWFCVRSAKEAMCKKNTIYVAVIGIVFQAKVDLSLGEASEQWVVKGHNELLFEFVNESQAFFFVFIFWHN